MPIKFPMRKISEQPRRTVYETFQLSCGHTKRRKAGWDIPRYSLDLRLPCLKCAKKR